MKFQDDKFCVISSSGVSELVCLTRKHSDEFDGYICYRDLRPQISVLIYFQGSCSAMKITLGLKDTICATFKDAGVNWESKLVAFGADGASVNLGKKAGLATLLRKQAPFSWTFTVCLIGLSLPS